MFSKIKNILNSKKSMYIPTHDDAILMCKENGELIFYESEYHINGYTIFVYNYRLAQYKNFQKPFQYLNGNYDANELRGLTFVYDKNGIFFKRYLLLRKFWNVNQVPDTQINELKKLKIKNITNKDDGSMISFIELPDGNIIPRTKAGFDNDQTRLVQDLLVKKPEITDFVKYCLKLDIIPIFEFVSFRNKIVLNYSEEKLVLLKLRNNINGDYLDLKEFVDKYNKKFNTFIEIVEFENYESLDQLMEILKTKEDKEGCVVEFENNLLVKFKSAWYFDRHQLLTEELNQENCIIKLILEEKIDDIYSQLDDEKDKLKIEWIKNIESIVFDVIEKTAKEIMDLASTFEGDLTKTKEENKDAFLKFISNNKKDQIYFLTLSYLNYRKDIYQSIKEFLLKRTYRLEQAREFLKTKKL